MTSLPKGRLQVHLDFGAGLTPILLGECLWVGAQEVAAFEWSEQALALLLLETDTGRGLSPPALRRARPDHLLFAARLP